ncbi:MAG: sigma-70 family RNA polymerase sigma factor [Endozoicomonadaceae bacterium]|nr:sigma-70 family RNA polymerase sigma factor [Endozoicomonadaceae bacterium]
MQKDISQYFKLLQQKKTQRNFKKVFELSNVQLFGVIIRILRQKELSEDCLQEVYVKIWHRMDSYVDDKASAMTWMSTIARNHAIDYIRKRQLPIQDDFELSVISDDQLHFLDNLEQKQTNQELSDCLQQLKPDVMNVLLMSYFKGLTYENIAKTLQVPVNTIKTWIRRAMPVLKKCLENTND